MAMRVRGERWTFEEALAWLRQWMEAGLTVVGIDEAGRGPLAGPVVAAAVLLPPHLLLFDPPLFHDSKRLNHEEREQLFLLLKHSGALFAIGKVSPAEIDRLNIRRATALAMRRALKNLTKRYPSLRVDMVLVDGDSLGDLGVPCRFIVGGDATCPLISAASIVAKVVRDRLMVAYDKRYPHYGFAQHKGYPTSQHLEALRRFGPSPIHRRSFEPVRSLEHPASP